MAGLENNEVRNCQLDPEIHWHENLGDVAQAQGIMLIISNDIMHIIYLID